MPANTGMAKNGKNQMRAVKNEPNIGLNTFPAVLEVSIMPSVALASSSFSNMSLTSGMTTGIAPDAPIPCNMRPSKTTKNALSIFQAANPEIGRRFPST